MVWRGRREEGSGWGTHVYLWQIHVDIWQNQYNIVKLKNNNKINKERWQEYTEELYKKDIHDPDNHDDVITHLEPEILECKVKWALGSINLNVKCMNKASGGDGIPIELFQILKDDAVKCCTQYAGKFGNSAVAKGLEKVSFHSNPKERQCQRMLRLLHNCTLLTC